MHKVTMNPLIVGINNVSIASDAVGNDTDDKSIGVPAHGELPEVPVDNDNDDDTAPKIIEEKRNAKANGNDDSVSVLGASGHNERVKFETSANDSFLITDQPSERSNFSAVTFKTDATIEDILHISRASMYNSTEIKDYWGESGDDARRKTSLMKDVRDMFRKRQEDNTFTTLGIEGTIGKGKKMKKLNRMVSRQVVMGEQDFQNHEGEHDDKIMAEVYSAACVHAIKSARKKGEQLHERLVNEEDGVGTT